MDPAIPLIALLQLADYGQSKWAAEHCPTSPLNCYENNPILGKHPSVGKVGWYFVGETAGIFAIRAALPSPWNTRYEWFVIGYSLSTVDHNAHVGIKVSF